MLTRHQVALVFGSALLFAVLAVAQQGDVPEKPVKLRALATLEARREGCDKHYINLAMSADGKRLYAVARWEYANTPPPPVPLGQLECWERTEDGAQLVWLADVTERLVSLPTRILVLSPDNKHLALGLSDRVVVFDTANGKPVRELLPDMPDGVTDRVVKALAFSPDGRALAGSYWGQKIHVWDFASGKTLKAWQAFDVGCNQILTMRFLESGNVLAITGNYHRVAFYDWQQARLLSAWEVRDLKDEKSTTRYVYDLEIARCGDKTYWVSAHGDSMHGRFFDGASEGHVEVRDEQGRLLYSRKAGGAVLAVAVSPDGRWFAHGECNISWRQRPVAPGEPVPFRPILDYFHWPSAVHVRETETGRHLAVLEGHKRGITDVAISPDGRWLASCSNDGTIRLWQTPAQAAK